MKGYVENIEQSSTENAHFRKVLYTGTYMQLVLMSLEPNEDIGEEVHDDVDQFFRIESGSGVAIINDVSHDITDGTAVIVPAGAKHNIINSGTEALKLYTLYSPPNHKDGAIHPTKAAAEADSEHFDGITTE